MTFLSHSQLPQPILFKDIDTSKDLSNLIQIFMDTYAATATRFTIDDDNVGRGLICAFFRDSQIKGVMVYAKKNEIKEYLTKQGFHCTLESALKTNRKPGMLYIENTA